MEGSILRELPPFLEKMDPNSLALRNDPSSIAIKTAISFVGFMSVWILLYLIAPKLVLFFRVGLEETIVPMRIDGSVTRHRKLRASWALKFVSILHALLVAFLSIWALFAEPVMKEVTGAVLRFDEEAAAHALVHQTSKIASFATPITMGYFIFDLCLVPVWEGTLIQWIPVFLHHGISLLAWPIGLSHPVCHWFLLTCLSMEASTPFVQLRWFLKMHATKDGPLYLINGLVMTIAFFACRVFVMPHNVWAVWISAPHSSLATHLPPHVRAACSVLVLPNILNLFWAFQMVKGLLRLFSKGSGHSKQQQQPKPRTKSLTGIIGEEEGLEAHHYKAA